MSHRKLGFGYSCTFADHAVKVLSESAPRLVGSSFPAHIYQPTKRALHASDSLQEKGLGPFFCFLVHVFSRAGRSQKEAVCSPTEGCMGLWAFQSWGLRDCTWKPLILLYLRKGIKV